MSYFKIFCLRNKFKQVCSPVVSVVNVATSVVLCYFDRLMFCYENSDRVKSTIAPILDDTPSYIL